mgnify:FL=1
MMKRMAVLMTAAAMMIPTAAFAEEDITAADTVITAEAAEEAEETEETEADEEEEIIVADKEDGNLVTACLEVIIDGTVYAEEFEIPVLVEYIDTDEILLNDEIRTSFRFENSEVVIEAEVSPAYRLPADSRMNAEKITEGTDAYAAAKIATVNSLGTDDAANYSFYDVNFTVNGETVELDDVQLTVNFKHAGTSVLVKDGAAKVI